MKKLLSLLMCYVFLQAETFALRGGPSGRNGVEQINGAYSGILTDTSGSTNMGMFLLTAIQNGASTGQTIFFSSSATETATYSGTITGLSDTTTGKFTGIIGATDATGINGTQTISGQLVCTATKSTLSTLTQRLSGTASTRTISVIIAGANIQTTIGPLTTYSVDGWRTSTTDVGNPFPTAF